ncbi:porin [Crenobacter sp. SG2303]|uniref:Porin n=1 Tax=Crenobacter oryzisoli TaxID=3056844 RepID=A0ABT7XT77_9NEIS|nr:porin [Crenobacter sp. SG2303]MDN0076978.1 porin [Crenobacter sp. SG2303]
MQKKIIAGLIASALAAPLLAHADVTMYGTINMAVESTQVSGATNPPSNDVTKGRVVSKSIIGFKGNEDLGSGLKAIWQVEQEIRGAEQGGTNDKGQPAVFATRNTFVGLSHADYGTFLIGNYDSAYKRLTNRTLNVLPDTTLDTFDSTSIFSRGEARLKNSVNYTTPVWNGFQGGLSYAFDETRSVDNNPTDPNFGKRLNADRVSLGLNYQIAGLNVGAGWDHSGDGYSTNATTNITSQKTAKTDFYKVGVSYKFDFGTMIGAGYEARLDEVPGQAKSRQADWLFAASQDIGAFSLKAAYARLGQQTANGQTVLGSEAKQWLAGVTYDLSKRTQAYVYGTKITNGSAQNVNFNAGTSPVYDANSNFGTPNASLGKGEDLRAIGVGLKTSF